MTSQNNSNSTERYYDYLAADYDNVSCFRKPFIRAVDQLIYDEFTQLDVSWMLDVGSGNGKRAKALAEALKATNLVLSDISSKMILACKKNAPNAKVVDLRKTKLDELNCVFDCITLQWNVLGHVETYEKRLELLRDCVNVLSKNGKICLDINHRHNLVYGILKVLFRVTLDWIWPNFKRGDVVIEKIVDGVSVKAKGHLFIMKEIESLAFLSGLRVKKKSFVNYSTGETCKYFFQGQLFYVLVRLEDAND